MRKIFAIIMMFTLIIYAIIMINMISAINIIKTIYIYKINIIKINLGKTVFNWALVGLCSGGWRQ